MDVKGVFSSIGNFFDNIFGGIGDFFSGLFPAALDLNGDGVQLTPGDRLGRSGRRAFGL
ncbi:hypothetical protein [Methylocystis sp.]|uniref:hypothetical protein n=1 Tax=Methylocystis sp. TaxID=1911079 RepID=UPI003DA2C020